MNRMIDYWQRKKPLFIYLSNCWAACPFGASPGPVDTEDADAQVEHRRYGRIGEARKCGGKHPHWKATD